MSWNPLPQIPTDFPQMLVHLWKDLGGQDLRVMQGIYSIFILDFDCLLQDLVNLLLAAVKSAGQQAQCWNDPPLDL